MTAQRDRKKAASRWILLILCFIITTGLSCTFGWMARGAQQNTPADKASQLGNHLHNETVDVVGGSMAHGWLDPHNDSYLRRAFAARSGSTNTTYHYVDHTIIGETPYMLRTSTPGRFTGWLKQDKPQVVVISWGILNSMTSRHKTTMEQFISSLHDEITAALQAHAVVLIVTPPVTKESATYDHEKQAQWMHAMFQMLAAFRSKNIYTIDVYQQMADYLKAHGQTYQNYYGNSWHPNQAGHILAGNILANDLVKTFGVGPITWRQ